MSNLYVNKKRNRELYKINKKKVRKKATDFASNIFFIRHTWYILQRYSTYCWHKIQCEGRAPATSQKQIRL